MLTDCSGGRRETAVMKALVTTALSHVSCPSLSYYLCDFPLDLRVYLNQLHMCLLSVWKWVEQYVQVEHSCQCNAYISLFIGFARIKIFGSTMSTKYSLFFLNI